MTNLEVHSIKNPILSGKISAAGIKKILKRRSKKIGAPPGSLIYTGEAKSGTPSLRVILYDSESFIEKQPQTITEALTLCKGDKSLWIHITGIFDPQLIHAVGKHFKLHPLLLEDIMNPSQRSKLDDYKDYIYIAAHNLDISEDVLEDEQISLVFGSKVLISFSEKEVDVFKPIRERLIKPGTKMRQLGSDYLAYTILDYIVDDYFYVLEKIDEQLVTLEIDLLKGDNSSVMYKIQMQKRELMIVRKAIWPMREVISQFRRIDSPLICETTRLYVYDVYDHAVQAIEAVESFRDLVAGMHDIYVATINQKMNETMKVLTVVATIFVPLTFITSLYGMNFEHMPELHTAWGYPAVLVFMALTVMAMLIIFRRKDWI